MKHPRRKSPLPTLFLGLALSLVLATGAAATRDDEPAGPAELGLRVQDVTVREDGVAVVVVRTYAPRPLGAGQLCIRPRTTSRDGATSTPNPFIRVIAGMVWNQEGDANCTAEIHDGPDGQEVVFNFDSPLGTVNSETDGPLMVLWLETAASLAPGDVLQLELDLGNSNLVDDEGNDVRIVPRNGEMSVSTDTSPVALRITSEAVTDDGVPTVAAWVSTEEELSLEAGRFSFSYPVDAVIGTPDVDVPWELDGIQIELVDSEPGTIVVDVTSPEAVWGEIPGPLLTIRLTPVAPSASFFLGIEPESWLRDSSDQLLDLDLEGADVTGAPSSLFSDGFENGLSAWGVL